MAAAVTSAWGKPGAWALDSEEHEAELLQQQKDETTNKSNHPHGGDAADFPSLATAAATKTKKKKPQTMPLAEFTKQSHASQSRGLTAEDLMMLPTGPRERTAEELDRSRLGGGFRSYGYDRNRYSEGDESSNSRWGSSRVSDESRKGGFGRDSNRELAPSRADEVDDWGSTKKSVSGNGFERRERGDRGDRGGFFGSESRADECESWVSSKSFAPPEARRSETQRERRVGFQSSGGADSDNWLKKKEEDGQKIGASGGSFDSLRERRGGFDLASNGGADSDSWSKKREEGIASGRPRLNLQPRTFPVGDGRQNGSVPPPKPKGSNPFGAARPREEVLKEKGQDWKEVDEKLESMKIKEMVKDGSSFGKRSFGSGNGRATTPEDRAERSWRKPDAADVRSPSGEKVEDGLAKEAVDMQG